MTPRLRGWQAAAYAGVLLYLAFEIARSLWRADLVVFSGYIELGESILAGRYPYHIHLNTWPPFFGLVAAGIALLARISSLHAVLLLWQLGAVAAIWACCVLLARFFEETTERLTFWPAPEPGRLSFTSSAVIVPVLASARILQEHLQHTQVNIFLLFLSLLAFAEFREGRAVWGGLALAMAASIKAVPVLLVSYLLYKKRWRDAAWTITWLIILNVLVLGFVFGPSNLIEQWQGWRAVAAREIADPTAEHRSNQSLLAVAQRVVASPQAAVTAFYVTAALLAAGLALAFRGGSNDLRSRRSASEYAIGLVAMTLVTPLAWKAHFVTLLAGYWFVWWGIRQLPAGSARRWCIRWFALSVALVTLSAPALVGRNMSAQLERWNAIALGALVVIGLGVWLLRRLPQQPPASSAVPRPP